MKPKVCILQTEGTNCDRETKYAFELAGGEPEIVHINSLIKKYDPVKREKASLDNYHILALPGGFSHGDYIGSGKVLAQYLKQFLEEDIKEFIQKGKPVIGICNGFQVQVKAGLLPNLDEKFEQTTTLTNNESQRFGCRWVKLVSPENKCIWTKGIESIDLPVAHGEGRFYCPKEIYSELVIRNLVVFQYADSNLAPTMKFPENPNGSLGSIAGICDPSGLVFGLMPHPERYNNPANHRLSSLQKILSRDYVDKDDPIIARRISKAMNLAGELPEEGSGLKIFRNGVKYVVEKFGLR